MAFNINSFISTMAADGFRPNLFEISFTDAGGTLNSSFSVRAKASSIPASTIGTASTFYFGRQAKFAGNRVFSDWTVTVLMDEGDFVGGVAAGPRAKLEQWSSSLNSHVGNKRDGNSIAPAALVGGYQKDADVILYGKDGVAITTYKMENCFPIDIGAVNLDWQANDTIAEFQVTFALNFWTRVGVTDIA